MTAWRREGLKARAREVGGGARAAGEEGEEEKEKEEEERMKRLTTMLGEGQGGLGGRD